MNDAIKKSEEFQIEQAMLDDKLKATDWEATNEEIMELVARESYLQWIKDNENRNNPRNAYLNLNQNQVPSSFTNNNNNNNNNENAATCSTWDTNQVNRHTHSPNRKHTRAASRRSSTATPPPSFSNPLTSSSLSTSQSKLSNQSPKVANENNKTNKKQPQYFDDLNYLMQQNDRASNSNEMMTSTSQQLDKNTQIAFNNTDNNEYKNLLRYDDEENMSMQYQYDYDVKFSDPHMYGLPSNDWNALDDGGANNDSDILARVLAASQQEYLESLKAKRNQQQHQGGH
jgi:OTU domain-containing protein 5